MSHIGSAQLSVDDSPLSQRHETLRIHFGRTPAKHAETFPNGSVRFGVSGMLLFNPSRIVCCAFSKHSR